jgi:RHS repeat-associated protein
MATYEENDPIASGVATTFAIKEQHLYGSSRIGIKTANFDPSPAPAFTDTYTRSLGFKNFELTNHLGNVITVITDRKLAHTTTPTSGIVDYFSPEIVSSNDYYAFGMPMPGRKFTSSSTYRYGFNGKENDNETVGTGEGTQDYGFRIYNPSLGKFLSVDPLTKEYPWNSTYAFAENDVIRSIDLDGLEKSYRYFIRDNYGVYTLIKEVKYSELFPGKEYGSDGAGTKDFVYNDKIKKFGEGQYKPTFAEEHPFKAFFGSEYGGRYEDKKGLKQLGKDIKTGAKQLETASGQVKLLAAVGVIAGTSTAQPEIVAGSVLLYEFAGTLETTADAVEISVNVAEGDGKNALNNTVKVMTDKAAGNIINSSGFSEGEKVIIDEVAGDAMEITNPDAEKE